MLAWLKAIKKSAARISKKASDGAHLGTLSVNDCMMMLHTVMMCFIMIKALLFVHEKNPLCCLFFVRK